VVSSNSAVPSTTREEEDKGADIPGRKVAMAVGGGTGREQFVCLWWRVRHGCKVMSFFAL
jgi:hypothetical protein